MTLGRNLLIGALLAGFLIAAGHARAAVVDAGPGGFVLHQTAMIAAPPDTVWARLIAPSRWWSPVHSYSHDASNFTLDARAGGCWCEALPGGGSAEHMHVVFVKPATMLRMTGALGPFQAMGGGVMTFGLAATDGGTTLTVDYTIYGYATGGLAKLAPIADGVISLQVARLKAAVETGSPDISNGEKP